MPAENYQTGEGRCHDMRKLRSGRSSIVLTTVMRPLVTLRDRSCVLSVPDRTLQIGIPKIKVTIASSVDHQDSSKVGLHLGEFISQVCSV